MASGRVECLRVIHAVLPGLIEVGCSERQVELGKVARHQDNSGRFRCQSVARSKTRAVRSRFSSAKAGARSCKPMGRFEREKPQGIARPGMPAKLAVIV